MAEEDLGRDQRTEDAVFAPGRASGDAGAAAGGRNGRHGDAGPTPIRGANGKFTGGGKSPRPEPKPAPAKAPTGRGPVKPSPVGDLITEGLGALTEIAAISRGPHWRRPPEQLARVGACYAAVIDHYFPAERVGEASLLGGAAIATAAAFGPPIVVDMLKAKAELERRAARNTAYGSHAAAPPEPYYQPPPPPSPSPAVGGFAAPGGPPFVPPNPGDLPDISPEQMEQFAAQAFGFVQQLFGQQQQEAPPQ